MSAVFEFTGTVFQLNTYNGRVESKTPATILATTKQEAREKALAAFGATYDEFRKFWSHDFAVASVREVPPHGGPNFGPEVAS